MPYSHSTSLVLRDPPPVTVAFAHPASAMLPAHSLPVAGAGSQNSVGCEAARAQPRWVIRALSKPSCGGSRASWLLGGLASLPAWASASLSKYLSVHRSSRFYYSLFLSPLD